MKFAKFWKTQTAHAPVFLAEKTNGHRYKSRDKYRILMSPACCGK